MDVNLESFDTCIALADSTFLGVLEGRGTDCADTVSVSSVADLDRDGINCEDADSE